MFLECIPSAGMIRIRFDGSKAYGLPLSPATPDSPSI